VQVEVKNLFLHFVADTGAPTHTVLLALISQTDYSRRSKALVAFPEVVVVLVERASYLDQLEPKLEPTLSREYFLKVQVMAADLLHTPERDT
jgi:hypothetical protein